jgi:putative methionine-R-sulfoxide reductase with GAF domain
MNTPQHASGLVYNSELTPEQAASMRRVVEAIWSERAQEDLSPDAPAGVSWVGFYSAPGLTFDAGVGGASSPTATGGEEMLLICREPKPACSPIGLHGKCGHGYLTGNAVIVDDVATLSGGVDNEAYVACDPNDRSEVVVPCVDDAGRVYAVLDLDSYQPGAFTPDDVRTLHAVLVEHGLTRQGATPAIDTF